MDSSGGILPADLHDPNLIYAAAGDVKLVLRRHDVTQYTASGRDGLFRIEWGSGAFGSGIGYSVISPGFGFSLPM
jgi:hypothetical protein